MTRASPIFNAFNAGELSPLLEGRPNVEVYDNGLRTCLNWIPLVQGPITARPGTKFVHPTKDNGAARLQSFEFSTTQAYMLEFGNLYARFFRNHSIITGTAQNITGITKANPAVVTYDGSDTYANGDRVIISGVVGMVEVNNREFTVANVNTGTNTFELSGVDSSSYTTYSSGGTVSEIYEIVSPYATAHLFELKTAQSADVLYIAHPSYAPRKLTRTGHTSWTLTEIDFLDGPYLPTNTTSTTLTLSGTSGSVTVTASATGIFAATDVGRLIRWKDPANNWTWLEITAYTDTDEVTATIRGANASAGTATVNWRLGLWSDTTGYPAAVTFYGDRLFWGGSTNTPQRLDGSVVGDYENFKPSAPAGTVADDDALGFTLNANKVSVIHWLSDDEKGLIVGTVGGEWIVRPSSSTEALTPTNVQATRSTTYGSKNVEPVRVGKATCFVQRSGRKLRELAYIFEDDGFRAPDLTIRSEHITLGGMSQLAYTAQPQSLIWAVRGDGVLLGFTYERDQEVLGWHRQIIGGSFSSGDAVVESIAAIPNPDGTADELWLIVKRTINGGTKRYVEYLTPFWEEGMEQEDAFFVDGGLTYDGSAATTISGLFHLAGETVTVLADGATHPDVTVSATGSATLSRSASVVQIGFGYESDAYTVRPDAGAQDGTAQGKIKRTRRTVLRLWKSLGLKIGKDENNLDPIIFREVTDSLGQAPPLFTGDTPPIIPKGAGYDTDGGIFIKRYQPFPATILAVMPRITTQEGG